MTHITYHRCLPLHASLYSKSYLIRRNIYGTIFKRKVDGHSLLSTTSLPDPSRNKADSNQTHGIYCNTRWVVAEISCPCGAGSNVQRSPFPVSLSLSLCLSLSPCVFISVNHPYTSALCLPARNRRTMPAGVSHPRRPRLGAEGVDDGVRI